MLKRTQQWRVHRSITTLSLTPHPRLIIVLLKKKKFVFLRVKNIYKLCTQCGRVTYVPVTQPLIYQRRAKNELTGKKLIYWRMPSYEELKFYTVHRGTLYVYIQIYLSSYRDTAQYPYEKTRLWVTLATMIY